MRIGPGAMQGDGVNRAQATYSVAGTTTASNIASAKVQVTGGVFSDKGFILGKVFMDCNANGVQDKGEPGVPGVRLYLEDGTYVVTDGGGKYSFYGIANRTHVVKADRTTLPAGARLETISARNLGDPGSRIVDLKAGELARADFAIAGCDAVVVAEVKARAKATARGDELIGARRHAAPHRGARHHRREGASRERRGGARAGEAECRGRPRRSPRRRWEWVASPRSFRRGRRSCRAPRRSLPSRSRDAPREAPALESLVPGFADNKLAFVGLADGQTMPYAQLNVRVKGAAGTTFGLSVNGAELPASRVGKRSVLAEKEVQAWEFIGVELKPGENTLSVDAARLLRQRARHRDDARDRADKLGKIVIEVPAAGGIADGKTPVKVVVTLADAKGVPVTVRTAVTLEATRGRWQVEDLDAERAGRAGVRRETAAANSSSCRRSSPARARSPRGAAPSRPRRASISSPSCAT